MAPFPLPLSLSLQIFLAAIRNNCYHLWFPFLEDLLNNDVQTTNVQNLTHRNFTQVYRRKSYARNVQALL
jgi:hypothetical protein